MLSSLLPHATTSFATSPVASLLRAPNPQRLPLTAYASVVIPALNEARRISDVVRYAFSDPATFEVIVIDDSSVDDTVALARQAGAIVLTSSMLGKGASMQDGIAPSRCDYVVYLDGDLAGLRPGLITELCAPLLDDTADFVKARFGRGGGRVTELTAKPMLKIFFPELAHIAQPLGGVIAAKKGLLRAMTFEDAYGVDVGLLIDAQLAGARIAEVDIGSLDHESQSLHDLTFMANEVGRVIFSRARSAGRLHVDQIAAMYENQRLAASGIDYVLTRRRGRTRLLLLEMDHVITEIDFASALAKISGHDSVFAKLTNEALPDITERNLQIAKCFQYVHKKKFEQVAHALPLRAGVIDFVNTMRRRGFMVGIVTQSYFVAAEIVRRRIFADFAIAHTMVFENEVCTGQLRVNPAFIDASSPAEMRPCKRHVLERFLSDEVAPKIDQTWIVSDCAQDRGLMHLADRGFAFALGQATSEIDWTPLTPIIVDTFSQILDVATDQFED